MNKAFEMSEGARKHRAGNLSGAEKHYRKILKKFPGDLEAKRLIAVIRLQSGQHREAEKLLRQCLRSKPDHMPTLINLASVLRQSGSYPEAISMLLKANSLSPKSPEVTFNLGNAYRSNAELDQAVEWYQATLNLKPDHTQAIIQLGHASKSLGRIGQAEKQYRSALALRPALGELYWALASLKSFQFSSQDRHQMQQLLDSSKLDPASRCFIHFAMAHAHEDQGEYDQAFQHYQKGNQLKRRSIARPKTDRSKLAQNICNVFNPELIERFSGHGDTGEQPIFIVSMPRSGSTLIEQILASHSEVTGAAELPDMGNIVRSLNQRFDGLSFPDTIPGLSYLDIRNIGSEYLKSTARWQESTPYFTDKMPNNFFLVGVIALALPNARIIHSRRNAIDICLSCYRQLFAKGHEYSYSLEELADYYNYYERLMQHWHQCFPGRIHDIQYEQVLADPENQIRQLLAFCGLGWEDACLEFHKTKRQIRTASAGQVTQPLYQTSSGRWKHYEQHLQPLIERLRDFKEESSAQ